MKQPVISPDIDSETENPGQIYPAVLFRRCVYVGMPRHMDAIKMAFDGMTHQQKHYVRNRISDGKEKMLFGWATSIGEWQDQPEYQNARMIMYGFD